MRTTSLTLSCLLAVVICSPLARAGQGNSGKAILGDGTVWRTHFTWRTPGSKRYGGASYRSPLPPADWTKPEFGDGTWARWRIGRRHGRYFAYGIASDGALGNALKLLCMRGRFTVANPGAARLSLNLSYRGGVVVYVNGKEIKRQHLAAKDDLDALAEKYPPEAFYLPNGMPLRSVGGALGGTHKTRVERRIRRIRGLAIPNSLLKKGVNVLALEIHAAPFPEKVRRRNGSNYPCLWTPCGPISVKLSGGPGAKLNASRPKGLQIWSAGVMARPTRFSYVDPHEKIQPVRIIAARNGIFCGQVVVGADSAIRGLKAEMSALEQEKGKGNIPASASEILYAHFRAGRYGVAFAKNAPLRLGNQRTIFDPLSEEPPSEVLPPKSSSRNRDPDLGAVQPVYVKVRVPADAAPGEYRGKLTVTANGGKTELPVYLRVIDWKLPDPKEYKTLVGLIQSPDTVAIQYKVPLWSDEHFKLMEKSYALMGQAGAKFVWLPMLTRTNLGNSQTIVRWTGNGRGYKPDFKVFDRYMDMVQKHMKPTAVCLYVYDRYTDYAGRSRATPARIKARGPNWKHRGMAGTDAWKISVLDPKTGKVAEKLAPQWRKSVYDPAAGRVTREELLAENKGFYETALKETRARLQKRGLGKAVMIGIEEDLAAKKTTHQFFSQILPGTKWVRMCHPVVLSSGVGYNSAVYVPVVPPPIPWDAKRKSGWQHQQLVGLFPRTGGVTANYMSAMSQPGLYRVVSEVCQLTALTGRYPMQGLARVGADYWPVLGREAIRPGVKRAPTLCARYPETCWDQLNFDRAIENILAPGPKGAITTVRFENYREGIQECEARIFIEKAIAGGKLDPEFKKKCQQLLDERHNIIRAACIGAQSCHAGGFKWYAASGSEGLAEKLFECAAEVAGKIGAR